MIAANSPLKVRPTLMWYVPLELFRCGRRATGFIASLKLGVTSSGVRLPLYLR
jgi:hypothetical protein